jgi:hypothetical protein
MTDYTYAQLKAQAILGCESAGEIISSLSELAHHPDLLAQSLELAKITLAGAQVYATLAVAEAEKDSMREFTERVPKKTSGRAPSQMPPVQPPRPVTPINKFRGENN